MFLRHWRLRKTAILAVFILIIIITARYITRESDFISLKHALNVAKERPVTTKVNEAQVISSEDHTKAEAKAGQVFIPEDRMKYEAKSGQVFFPEDRTLTGYLVYDCSRQRGGLCGGWSDRMSGILSTFGIAIISRRHFKIQFDKPCALDNFLEPNMYNWKLDKSKIPTDSNFLYLIDNNCHSLRVQALKTKHLEGAFKTNVTFIRMNWDISLDFSKRPDIEDDFPWVTKLQYADMYYGLYHYLFKPGKTVLQEFDNLQKRRKHKLLACSHTRAGDPGNKRRDFSHIWKFLSKLDRSKYDIFIASDQQYARDDGINWLKGYDVITTPGVLGNMDLGAVGCDLFKTCMVDFYTLTTCDLLVITSSGFSILSAYVRGTSDNLYCMGEHGVFPCSRNTLEDIYPGNMLAPPLKEH